LYAIVIIRYGYHKLLFMLRKLEFRIGKSLSRSSVQKVYMRSLCGRENRGGFGDKAEEYKQDGRPGRRKMANNKIDLKAAG